jgi:F0F1-type ATP synthase assembly protein I
MLQPHDSGPSGAPPESGDSAARARAAEQKVRREADSIERRVGFQMLGLGWQMSTEVIAGAALGWGVDHFFGTAPKGVLVGSLVGVVVAIYSLVRGGLRLYKSVDRADAMRKQARQAAERADGSAAPSGDSGPGSG